MLLHPSILHLAILFFLFKTSNVENVVAADEDLAEVARTGTVNVLLRICQLQVHVGVHRDEVALVLHAPLELHHDRFSGEAVEKRFWVQR